MKEDKKISNQGRTKDREEQKLEKITFQKPEKNKSHRNSESGKSPAT